MTKRSPFTFLGVSLLAIGLPIALTPYLLLHPTLISPLITRLQLTLTHFFFMHLTSLTALGASMLILAIVLIALGAGQPGASADIIGMLSDAGLINTALLIREVGPASRAIYLPSSFNGGKARVLLQSLGSKPMPNADNPGGMAMQPAPKRADPGILITTLGSLVVERFAPLRNEGDLESAISPILVGLTDLADGLKVVEEKHTLVVEVTNPRIRNGDPKIFGRIGSPLASVVASAIAEVKAKPVEILHEAQEGKRYIILIGFAE